MTAALSAPELPPAAPSSVEAQAAARASAFEAAERLRGRVMAGSLSALLDRVRGSRQVLPFLAALERALIRQGAAEIQRIPPQHLHRIFGQLRALPSDADDEPFKDLMRRVHRQLRHHTQAEEHRLAPFDPEATVVISEGSHSEFLDALAAQEAVAAQEARAAPPQEPR